MCAWQQQPPEVPKISQNAPCVNTDHNVIGEKCIRQGVPELASPCEVLLCVPYEIFTHIPHKVWCVYNFRIVLRLFFTHYEILRQMLGGYRKSV